MITERELLQAIEDCQCEPITSSKRGTLADLFIIYDHLFGQPINTGYSYENRIETQTIYTNGDTEFLSTVNGRNTEKVMAILDELMDATKMLHPRMYDQVIQKIMDA
jgi:hypothetical protein